MAAADMYVTAAGAGDNSGDSWANAMTIAEFETDFEGSAEAGDRYFFMGGQTYTLTQDIITALDGTAALPIQLIGVASGTTNEPPVASDWASGADRPTLACGAWTFTWDDYTHMHNFIATGTDLSILWGDTNAMLDNVIATNSSGTGNRYAFVNGAIYGKVINSELVCTNGYGALINFADVSFSYIHDCVNGLVIGSNSCSITFTIIDTCSTSGVNLASYDSVLMINDTIYACGTGITATDSNSNMIINCIINDCTTGANWTGGTNILNNYWDYNNWEGNTSDTSNVTKGNNATANDPQFDNAAGGDFGLSDNEGSCVGAAYAGELGGMGS